MWHDDQDEEVHHVDAKLSGKNPWREGQQDHRTEAPTQRDEGANASSAH